MCPSHNIYITFISHYNSRIDIPYTGPTDGRRTPKCLVTVCGIGVVGIPFPDYSFDMTWTDHSGVVAYHYSLSILLYCLLTHDSVVTVVGLSE